MSEFDHTRVSLGKSSYVHDERTLLMTKFMLPHFRIPAVWDFDKHRAKFPLPFWGNDTYGDCVIAGEANHVFRLERLEQRRTVPLTDQDAIKRYMMLTGCKAPGDAHDVGLEVIGAMRNWRSQGFQSAYKNRSYLIAAYGELDPQDGAQLRSANYLLHGIHFGFWLPAAAKQMTRNKVWDYQGQTGAEWQPGSWGGHLVYSKAFDPDGFEILTWGMKVKVTNAFIEKYCDEAWAVVDNLNTWDIKLRVDVAAIEKELSQITSKVDQ